MKILIDLKKKVNRSQGMSHISINCMHQLSDRCHILWNYVSQLRAASGVRMPQFWQCIESTLKKKLGVINRNGRNQVSHSKSVISGHFPKMVNFVA